jgi:hypothetical protein
MKRAAPILLPILLLGLAAPAAAQEEEGWAPTTILDAHVDPSVCNLRKARRITFGEAFRRAKHLGSACVAVTGYWADTALAADRASARAPDAAIDSPPGDRIGLYGRKHVRAFKPGTRIYAVGYLNDCAKAWPDAQNIEGYCHMREGPILILAQVVAR